MSRIVDIADVLNGKHDDEEVDVRGWMYNKRSSGGIQFLMMRDGSGVMQCTLNLNNVDESTFNQVDDLPLETSLSLRGTVNLDKRAPGGREISVNKVGDVIKSHPDFPITRKRHGVEFLLDNRHLYVRDPKIQTILRLRSKFMESARTWFVERGYTEAHSPSFITAACEGGSTLFNVDYFEKESVYLSQSWQLYAEAMICSLGKIYTIAPSFRAEQSRTRRHLSEYWHLEVEEPWTNLDGILKVGDELVTHICHSLAKEMPRELKFLGRKPKELLKLKPNFLRITYDEAVEIIQERGVEMYWGDDFSRQQEEPLTKNFETPFWVTGFPTGIKPFYHMPDPKRPEVTLSADLLAPEGYSEIIGCGQRVHNYDQLLERIHEDNLDPADYSWYLDLRKWGTVPHSGFGLGIERVLMWICKLDHIRDTTPFPRDLRRIFP